MKTRCRWASNIRDSDSRKIYEDYHDREWGRPVHSDQKLFEAIILDGFQAGLSWLTILKKRENFRIAFDNFDPTRIARYTPGKIGKLMADTGIIRNRLKIEAAVTNAKAFLVVQKEFGSFDRYIWQFTGGKTRHNSWKPTGSHGTNFKKPKADGRLPTKTKESDAMSLDLKNRGFKFVGSTICYAFMQAVGMVNDHTTDCFCYDKIKRSKSYAARNSSQKNKTRALQTI